MKHRPIRRALLGALTVLLVCCLWNRHGVRAGENDRPVRLGRQEISVEIDDRHSLAVTTVLQELLNRSWTPQEAQCELPIPDDAALVRFAVLAPPAGRDRGPRGGVVATGRSLYQIHLNRVPARATARFELVYAETLTRRGRRRKYVYPIPSPAAGTVPSALSVRIGISARAAPERVSCATHPMNLRRPAPHSVALSYTTDRPPNGRDLVLDYEVPTGPEEAQARLSVVTPGDRDQDPYFLLALPPPATLLHDSHALDRPADVVFCMDISGSTKGRKLNAIQEAIHDGLADLSPRDRFGLVAFDDDARPFHRDLVPATPNAVAQALRFLNRMRPGGGRDPGRALRAAREILHSGPAPGRSRARTERAAIIAIVVDDSNPADLAAQAAEAGLAGRGIRLLALGALPDARLVSYRLRGKRLQRGPAIALSRAALTFGPAMAGAAFDAGSLNASYIYPPPERLPDLPLSTPVLLLGRLNEAPPSRGVVGLTGKIEGQMRSLQVPYSWQPLSPTSPVPALWANHRIRRLQQLAQRQRRDATELSAAIPAVQQEHRLAAIPKP